MFNLEQAIAEWRQQMLAAGIQTPVPLEELEAHLREGIERQMQSGVTMERAFAVAVQRIGQANTLHGEFQKIEGKFMNQRLLVGIGAIGLLLSLFTLLPALGKHRERNQAALSLGGNFLNARWADDEMYGLRLSAGFFVAGTGVVIFGLKQRKTQGSQV